MRQALRDLDTQRDSYLRLKAKTAQMETRLGTTPVQLQGYVENAAKEAGVEISDSSDRAPTPAGKKFIERTVDLHLKPMTLDQLTKFMKAIETGRSLVVVKELSVRTRDDKHQQLDVDMVVSTFERDTGKGAVKKEKS